jgi:hypothetical protein
MSNVLSFCIGHKPITFHTENDFTFLSSKALGLNNELLVNDNRHPFGVNGSSLSEYSQLFYLNDLFIKGEINADYIYLFQYRKFISPIVYGAVDIINPYNRTIVASIANSLLPQKNYLDFLHCDLITGSIVNFNSSISLQYSKLHIIDDMVNFSACLASVSELNSTDINNFSTLNGFIPCPTLCFIKTSHFTYIMNILKKVSVNFLDNYFIKRDGYQYRSTGYLLERLHSILIFKLLRDFNDFNAITWQRYMIVDS